MTRKSLILGTFVEVVSVEVITILIAKYLNDVKPLPYDTRLSGVPAVPGAYVNSFKSDAVIDFKLVPEINVIN